MDNCMVCGDELDYIVEYCCNAFDCGCMGMPTEPPVCSRVCYDRLMKDNNNGKQ